MAIEALIVQSAGGDLLAYPRDRSLNELFKQIPIDLQASVADELEKSLQEAIDGLEKNAKVFETWRYSYEKGAWVDNEFLHRFVKAAIAKVGVVL